MQEFLDLGHAELQISARNILSPDACRLHRHKYYVLPEFEQCLMLQQSFSYLKPTVWISVLTSVGCFEGSRATGSVFQLFGKPGAVGSSTQKTCIYIIHYCQNEQNTWGCAIECKSN